MPGEPWFIYRKEPGRFRAMPASWQGWAVLLGGILLTIAAFFAVMRATEGVNLFVRILLGFVPNLIGILTISAIAYRTGRPSR
ncbi:hypothetical protein [Sphingomonas humi]|uniref:Uncharacterized protein n=1 Tax=Sphingomonas humi TaxID=335630 RepID=A0ABP7S7K8_9SPHN